MNQNISVKTGKHRHVSKNTITSSRLSSDRSLSPISMTIKKNKFPNITSPGIAKKVSFWGKLAKKLFKGVV